MTPQGYHGLDMIEYTPVDIHLDNISKYTPDEQCARSNNAQRELDQAIAGSVCRGMAEAIQAHEDHHVAECVRDGGQGPYFERSGVWRAREEAEAYQIQVTVLSTAIQSILKHPQSCPGWRGVPGGPRSRGIGEVRARRYAVVSAIAGSTRVVRSAGTSAATNAIAPNATIAPRKILV